MAKSLLPASETSQDQDLESAAGELISETFPGIDSIDSIFNLINQVGEPKPKDAWLDDLARLFKFVPWKKYWSQATKRKMLRFGLKLQQKAGTKWAVEEALQVIKPTARILDYPEKSLAGASLKPGYFQVAISDEMSSQESLDLNEIVKVYKPLSSKYKINQMKALGVQISFAAAAHSYRVYISQVKKNLSPLFPNKH